MTLISPTEPEPRGDIEAQFAALVDPEHPKRAVWVSKGTACRHEALRSFLLRQGYAGQVRYLNLEAGRLYASCARDLSQLAADPSLERLAQILGYLECKADLRVGELPVVQALNGGGWVVWEMASSWEWVGAAKDIASRYGDVRVVSMAACLERRARLIAEEMKAGERFDFLRLSEEEWAQLAYLWAVEKRSLGSLAREFGGRDSDTWQVRYAIECFVDDRAPRWVDDYSGLPALRAKVVDLFRVGALSPKQRAFLESGRPRLIAEEAKG